MFSVSVSKSISICNSDNIDDILTGDKIIITNETDALNTLINYFSEKINCQYCQTCSSAASFTDLNLKRKTNLFKTITVNKAHYQHSRVKSINTCYNTAVQVQIAEFFRSFDLNFDKKLTYHEFYKGFTSLFLGQIAEGFQNLFNETKQPCYIWIDEAAIRNLFLKFDLNHDGYVDFSDFVRGVRVPMCKKREDVLNQAFKQLDINKTGVITVMDLKHWYKINNMYNQLGDEKIEEIILLWMSNFSFTEEQKKKITREQFFDYYYVVSSTVIHDAYFDLLIRNTFHI